MYMWYAWNPWMLLFDCINYELWTNPKWPFGWPPTLFVWMGRLHAGVVCFSLVSCWRLALELPRFALESIESDSDLRVSVCLLSFWLVEILFTQCVELRIYIWWCSMIIWHGYLEVLYLSDEMLILFRCDVWEKLLMHVELIEEVTSRSCMIYIICMIYRFKSLGCYSSFEDLI
jgi:hypothetical protein